eukprot:SAG31_NODE_134_length_23213_cov_5.698624_9_plen_502_part_00
MQVDRLSADGDLGSSYVPARDNLRESLTNSESASSKTGSSRWDKVRSYSRGLAIDSGPNANTANASVDASIPQFASRFQNKLKTLAGQFEVADDSGSRSPRAFEMHASAMRQPDPPSAAQTFEVEPAGPDLENQQQSEHWSQSQSPISPTVGTSVTVENCLVILTGIAIGGVLYLLQSVLIPLIMAFFIASMLVPLLDILTERPPRLCGRTWCESACRPCMDIEKKYPNFAGETLTSILSLRLPNVAALIVVILLCAGCLFGVGLLVYWSVSNFLDHVELYIENMEKDGHHLLDFLRSQRIEPDEQLRAKLLSMLKDSLDSSSQASAIGFAILEQLTSTIATACLVLLYVIFILLGRVARHKRKGRFVTYAVERQLKLYVSWKFLISAATGTAIGGTLGLCNVNLAAMFGVLTFFLNFIPTVGLLLSVLLPIPVVLWGDNPKLVKFLAIVIPYGINLVVSNFVEPTIFGKRLQLHPVVVLFALVFWCTYLSLITHCCYKVV